MYSEDDLLMLSALQHIAFCERQCALIHIEQVWNKNRLTAQGRLMHERVHGQENETRGDIRSVRGLRLRSLEFGIAGVADLIEFHRCTQGEAGIVLSGVKGTWRVFPVEYKRGKPKKDRCAAREREDDEGREIISMFPARAGMNQLICFYSLV